MARFSINEPSQALPEGWAAVALGAAGSTPLQICVVASVQADPVAGHFQLLRNTLDAQVFLGCVIDQARHVHQYVELWVETPLKQADPLIAEQEGLRGRGKDDDRWPRLVRAIDRARPAELIRTGWEQKPLDPLQIDLSAIDPARKATGKVTFNPNGGRIMVRRHHARRLESHVQSLTAGGGGGSLFLAQHGKAGRLVETLHLKLRALADAVGAVSDHVAQTRLPLLNLGVESFGVDVAPHGVGLPQSWTARVELVESGCATELNVADSQTRFFLASGNPAASAYSPRSVQPSRGRAALRIRELAADASGNSIVRGTFATQERLHPSPMDLVWLRVPVGAGPIDLYARLEREKALAAGEFQFATVARKLPADAAKQLKSAEGVPFENVPFEHLPLLSTPCDLYALGVLGVRALLVNSHTTLPAALDSVFSLARQLAVEQQEGSPSLPDAIGRVVTGSARWLEALGPHRLVDDPIAPPDAMDLVPATLWWEVLAAIVRAFPGPGRFSCCKHYGDAPLDGLHKVFDGLSSDLQHLIERSRSLIVVDWRFNREVHALVRQYLTGLAGQKPPDPTIVSAPGANPDATPLVFSNQQVQTSRQPASARQAAPAEPRARRPALKETKG